MGMSMYTPIPNSAYDQQVAAYNRSQQAGKAAKEEEKRRLSAQSMAPITAGTDRLNYLLGLGPYGQAGPTGMGPQPVFNSWGAVGGKAAGGKPVYQPTNPYGGMQQYQTDWRFLIDQLRQQSLGQGPSLAQEGYRRASMENQAALGGLSRGSTNAAAGREAQLQQLRIGQGMAQGLGQARLQEQMAAQAGLGGAIGGAGQYQQGLLGLQNQLAIAQLNAQIQREAIAAGKEAKDVGVFEGAATGAAAGGAVGGPWGAAIGGGLGTLYGIFD